MNSFFETESPKLFNGDFIDLTDLEEIPGNTEFVRIMPGPSEEPYVNDLIISNLNNMHPVANVPKKQQNQKIPVKKLVYKPKDVPAYPASFMTDSETSAIIESVIQITGDAETSELAESTITIPNKIRDKPVNNTPLNSKLKILQSLSKRPGNNEFIVINNCDPNAMGARNNLLLGKTLYLPNGSFDDSLTPVTNVKLVTPPHMSVLKLNKGSKKDVDTTITNRHANNEKSSNSVNQMMTQLSNGQVAFVVANEKEPPPKKQFPMPQQIKTEEDQYEDEIETISLLDDDDQMKKDPLFIDEVSSSTATGPQRLNVKSVKTIDISSILAHKTVDKSADFGIRDWCKIYKSRRKQLAVVDPLEKGFTLGEVRKRPACVREIRLLFNEETSKISDSKMRLRALNKKIAQRRYSARSFLPSGEGNRSTEVPLLNDIISSLNLEMALLDRKTGKINRSEDPREGLQKIKEGLEIMRNWSCKIAAGKETAQPTRPASVMKAPVRRRRQSNKKETVKTETSVKKNSESPSRPVRNRKRPSFLIESAGFFDYEEDAEFLSPEKIDVKVPKKRSMKKKSSPSMPVDDPGDTEDLMTIKKIDILNENHEVISRHYNK